MSRTCKWPHRDSYLVHLLGKVDNASLAEMAIEIISIQFLGMKFSRHVLGSLTHERMQEVCSSSIENGKWQTSSGLTCAAECTSDQRVRTTVRRVN